MSVYARDLKSENGTALLSLHRVTLNVTFQKKKQKWTAEVSLHCSNLSLIRGIPLSPTVGEAG